ncbi:MAG TPA: SAM-dependent methyltransferase, partial [Acidimicrobiaceae bacterium]|nr:SAM-dependent methyltransferase [Acidimicrobiaceae bacterium]
MTRVASPDTADTARTWPFWAPSQAEAVEAALDLAGVGPGVHLLDLGCGDGQVLLAAARRGATVSGVEADADLVADTKEHLADAGVDADVRQGDLFDPAVD